jgi:flavin-binding protein dodecin
MISLEEAIMTVLKIIEVIGCSPEGWDEAAAEALKRACKTVKHVQEMEVVRMSAEIEEGEITNYKTTVKISFEVEEK